MNNAGNPGGDGRAGEREPRAGEDELRIVGIGASAGGLGALRTLFSKLPGDTGAAFVVVVHLSPEHESHLPDLLEPHCRMPVQQVTGTTALEANHVYIIPPNANLTAIDTHLRLSELEADRRERAPVDHFFRTLAEAHGERGIGVILTGAGSDGTLGIRRVKESGGVTFAQDPAEAEQGGMPRSAIASGMVDQVLSLERIGEEIVRRLGAEPSILMHAEREAAEAPGSEDARLVETILGQVRAKTGRDFAHYKRRTVLRRIARRMRVRVVGTLREYAKLLEQEREECVALADDLLITVTEFFRDREIFDHLEREVVPSLFEEKSGRDAIRVWSAGCSTGEEAYSLAMLLVEAGSRCEDCPRVQIFATDLHPGALRTAREGIYPREIESHVSRERIKRFFTAEHGAYRIKREIREMVVFAEHNILSDPPFSRVDLILCRNLLIYLARDVQREVISLFHYAMNPEGLLVLGTSETMNQPELFKVESRAAHVYRRRHAPPRERGPLPFPPAAKPREVSEESLIGRADTGGARARAPGYGQIHAELVERYAPPSVLVNGADDVVHASIRAGRYLEFPGGEPTGNVVRLAREPLQMELLALMRQARESGEGKRSKPLEVRFNGESGLVVLRVIPPRERDADGYLLIIFDEQVDGGEAPPEEPADETVSATVRELQAELEINRQRLQGTIEEYETSREELQSSNEELQSSNGELRSTLEELETSREELRSMNEELATVNQQSSHRVGELGRLADDLQNLLAATNIATLFLDRDLKIVRFTPAVGELFNIRHSDRGRPLTDLTHHLEYPEIESDARAVLEKLTPIEREVKASHNGQRYLMRLLPYLADEGRIDGVVITLIDITELKKAEEETEASRIYAESIVETLHEPLLVLNPDLTVRSANEAFFNDFEAPREETIGRKIYDLGNGQWEISELRELLEDVLPDSNVFNEYEVSHTFEDLGERVMLLNGRRLDHVQLILLGIRDITGRKRAEEELRESEERLRRIFDVDVVSVAIVRTDTARIVDCNAAFLDVFGRTRAQVESGELSWRDLTAPEFHEVVREQFEVVAETGRFGPIEKQVVRPDGSRRWVLVAGADLADGTVVEYAIDLEERKRVEAELREARAELEGRVAERTSELRLQAGRLRRLAGELAQAEHRERKRLAALLHDELQQLLAAAKMRLEAARRKVQDDEIGSALDKALELMSEALESSRDLTQQLRPPVLYEDGLVPAIRWLAKEMESRHNLRVRVEADDGQVDLPDDARAMLFSAVRELLFNVVKHAKVEEAVVRASRVGDRLVVRVEDEGLGIGDGQPDKRRESSGLGLFSIREHLAALGGEMRIESKEGGGTRIELVTPLDALDAVPAARVVASETRWSGGSRRRNESESIRVLLVDDHALVRQGLAEVLSHHPGIEVVAEAADGAEGIELSAKLCPDVVLLDVNLPKVGGVEATREIRKRCPEVVVIGFSVQAGEAVARSMRSAGAAAFVAKTEDSEKLVALIRRHAGGVES